MQKVMGSTSDYLEYHTVEDCAIVVSLFCLFDGVVAVKRSLIVKANCDVAERSLYSYFHC